MKFFKSFMFAYFRFFVIGLAVVVFVETGVLIYLNNVYFNDTGRYTASVISTGASSKVTYQKVTVDADAKNLTGSYDMHYVAYLKDGAIVVTDMTNGKQYTVDSVKDMRVSYFKWVYYNVERMMIAEVSTTGSFFKLYTYDLKDKALTEVRYSTNDGNYELKVSLNSKNDEITDIEMATQIVKTYVKVTDSDKECHLWEIDAANGDGNYKETKDNLVSSKIGNIQSMKAQDQLLYEANGKVYRYGSWSAISIGGVTSLSLLGFDGNDNVYLANTAGGSTRTIYQGSYDSQKGKWNTWNTLKLDKAVQDSDIYVQFNGDIYYNDTESNCVVKADFGDGSTSSPAGSSYSGSSGSSSGTSSKTASSKTTSSGKSGSSKLSSSSAVPANGTPYTGKVVTVCKNGFLTQSGNQIIPYEFK